VSQQPIPALTPILVQQKWPANAGGLQGGWPGAVLLAADHHRVVPAGLRARRPGRPAVLRRWPIPRLFHGRRGAAVDHAGAGADAAVHPRHDHARGEEPGEPLPDLGLSTDHRRRDALEEADRMYRAHWWCMGISYYPASRLGSEFMPTLNEGSLLYMPASLPGMSITKAAELLQTQDKIIKSFPEVIVGVRQGRARQHGHRSGADRDVRDRDQPQARVRMACRHDHRQADRRDGPGAAVPGCGQLLDHANQGAHRHAVHRHPHADRHQGLRQGPGRDGKTGPADRDRGESGARHHQRLCRAHHRRFLPEHRARSRATGALRPGGRRPARRGRHRAGRRDGHHHCGRAANVMA
jgi:hypothetical protein